MVLAGDGHLLPRGIRRHRQRLTRTFHTRVRRRCRACLDLAGYGLRPLLRPVGVVARLCRRFDRLLLQPVGLTAYLTRRSTKMRYLILLKAAQPATPPPPELMEAIMKLGDEATRSGALLDTAGLMPSAAGAKVD